MQLSFAAVKRAYTEKCIVVGIHEYYKKDVGWVKCRAKGTESEILDFVQTKCSDGVTHVCFIIRKFGRLSGISSESNSDFSIKELTKN